MGAQKLGREVRHYIYVWGLIYNVSTNMLTRELKQRGYELSREAVRLIKKNELETFKKRLLSLKELASEHNIYGKHALLTIHAIDCTLKEPPADLIERYYAVSSKMLYACDLPEVIYDNVKLFEAFDDAIELFLRHKKRDSEQLERFEKNFQVVLTMKKLEVERLQYEFAQEYQKLLKELLEYKQSIHEPKFYNVHAFWSLEYAKHEGGFFENTRVE